MRALCEIYIVESEIFPFPFVGRTPRTPEEFPLNRCKLRNSIDGCRWLYQMKVKFSSVGGIRERKIRDSKRMREIAGV